MTRSRRDMSLIEVRESTPDGQQGLAAARLALKVRASMLNALEVNGLSQKDLAERLGLTESRVSQVLHGDGNVHMSTFARFLRALGYKIDLSIEPVDSTIRPLPSRGSRRLVNQVAKKGVDKVTVSRVSKSGFHMQDIDFPALPEDEADFFVVKHKDKIAIVESAGLQARLGSDSLGSKKLLKQSVRSNA